MQKNDKLNHTIVAEKITSKLIDVISGRDEKSLIGQKPSEIVMLGMIKAGKDMNLVMDSTINDVVDFKSISSIGVTVRYSKGTSKINISIKGNFYYRTKPSYEQQIEYLLSEYSKKYKCDIKTVNELKDIIETNKSSYDFVYPNCSVMNYYRTIKLEECIPSFEFDLFNVEKSTEQFNEFVNEKLKEKIVEIQNASYSIPNDERAIDTFLSMPKYNMFLDSIAKLSMPNWSLKLYTKHHSYELYDELTVQVINSTLMISDPNTYDTTLYNTGLTIRNDNGFVPIKLNSIKHDYFGTSDVYALGINCAVTDKVNFVETSNIPMYKQQRIKTLDDFNDEITFYNLINKPIEKLKVINSKLEESLRNHKRDYELHKNKNSENYNNELLKDINLFEKEIFRFSYGIYLLENKKDVLNAFILMNKAFAKNKKGIKSWRLFQIVFIVSEINDMVYSEYNGNSWYHNYNISNVDMIYFSTGGGKTEAFLGCVTFSLFFDRIRGKKEGTTAFIKYPLRLLTTQQLDRVLTLLLQANEVKDEENISGEKFDVGLLIGKEVSPNRITKELLNKYKYYDEKTWNEKFRKIDYCPKCKKEVKVVFDEEDWKLKHTCPECGVLPVTIVDDEIFRKPTSIIVSSIDKMAAIGLFPGFKAIFGKNFGKCIKHGYVWNQRKKCSCEQCSNIIIDSPKLKDPVPTLFIQDELHLLNESLGTYDSHYETFIQYFTEHLLPEKDRKTIKFIGATATISEFQDHCYNLYLKNGVSFPTNIKNKNFYSYVDEDDLNRIIIAAALYGASITESIQKVVTLFRKIILDYEKKADVCLEEFKLLGFVGNSQDLYDTLNDYLISIIYNNSKMDSSNLQQAIENLGDNDLTTNNYPSFNIGNISGDEDFTKIKDIMHNIEITKDKKDTDNLILATSAISHGVDEDCFNQIFFFGMPNKTSEYIQSYSRVGRKYTGIVFDVIRIVRDRDRSYLKNFLQYHEFKELLIEPVPINRWAKMAIYSTLPGIVSAIILQYYNGDGWANNAHDMIVNNIIKLEDLISIVKHSYGCADATPEASIYSQIIEEEVSNIYYCLKNNSSRDFLSNGIAAGNKYGFSPMDSLRDVDVTLEVKLKGVE